MYVRGKVNYMDNIDVDLFNVDELHMFIQDLGYDPSQLMFYHYKMPNKSLDYGLRPLSCDANVVSLINLVANCKVVEVFVEYCLTNVDHQYLSPFKSIVKIEELDDDVLLNAPVVGSNKRLALGWNNEADVRESSVGKNDNVNVVGSNKRLALGWINEADVGESSELDDDVLLNAPVVESSKRLVLGWNNEADVRESSVGKNNNVNVVGSSKRLALGWINEADVGESSVGKNDNVNVDEHEEQTVNVNDYTIDDRFELDINENLNLDNYTVYVDENMIENVNVDGNVDENVNENVNEDDENMDADDEYEQDAVEDEEVIGNDKEDFIVDDEHVVDEVEVNMKGFTFSVQEQGPEQTVIPNVDLTNEALEVLGFDSFDSDVGDDTASITRRSVRKLRKSGGQSTGIVNTLFVGQEFPNKESAKARIKAYGDETRRKIEIVKNDSERLQAKCKGNVVESVNNVSQGNLLHAFGVWVKRQGIKN
ncbi:putative reverse transcriptase domain-containing protein [Tanacetum coccineum]